MICLADYLYLRHSTVFTFVSTVFTFVSTVLCLPSSILCLHCQWCGYLLSTVFTSVNRVFTFVSTVISFVSTVFIFGSSVFAFFSIYCVYLRQYIVFIFVRTTHRLCTAPNSSWRKSSTSWSDVTGNFFKKSCDWRGTPSWESKNCWLPWRMSEEDRHRSKKNSPWTSAQDVELFRQLFPDEGKGKKPL